MLPGCPRPFLGVLQSRLDRRWGWMRWSEETELQISNDTLFSGFSLLAAIELDLVVLAIDETR